MNHTILQSIHDGSLRERIRERVAAWRLEVSSMRETPSSIILFGEQNDAPIVLKVVRAPGDEWGSGRVLRAFDGHGIVRAIDHVEGAIVLERLEPGSELVELSRSGRDEEAAAIIADIIAAMGRSNATTDRFATIEEWGRGFARFRASGSDAIDRALVASASEEYERLASSQGDRRLLHGDLHHDNILDDSRRGWTAIDPKGVVGEAAYEPGAALRNPHGMPDLFTAPDVIRRRVAIFASRLALDPERILRWAFAQAVLATIWSVEDGEPVDAAHPFLRFARSAGTLF